MSYELASLPSTELVAPINRAVFPAYAQLAKESPGALRREYLSVIGIIVLIASPAVLGLAATSELLVPVLLGPNWTAAIPVLTLLAFFGFTNVVQSNAQAAYLALGRADVPAKLNALHVAVQLTALILLTRAHGLIGAAMAYLSTAAIMIPLSIGVVLRMLSIPPIAFILCVWRPITAAGLMYAGVSEYLDIVGSPKGAMAVAHLGAAVVIGAAIYLLGVYLLWVLSSKPPGAESTALLRVREVVGRFLSRRRPALNS